MCKYFQVGLKFIRIIHIVRIKIILLLFKAQKRRNKILSPFHRRVVLSKCSCAVVIVWNLDGQNTVLVLVTGTLGEQSTQWFQRCGQTEASSVRGLSCPMRQDRGVGLAQPGETWLRGCWHQPPVPVERWAGTWNVLAEILQSLFWFMSQSYPQGVHFVLSFLQFICLWK